MKNEEWVRGLGPWFTREGFVDKGLFTYSGHYGVVTDPVGRATVWVPLHL